MPRPLPVRADRKEYGRLIRRMIEQSGLDYYDFSLESEITPTRLDELAQGRDWPTNKERFNIWAAASWEQLNLSIPHRRR